MKKIISGVIVTSIFFTLFSYLFIDSNFSYLKTIYTGFHSDQRLLASVFYFVFIAVFFTLYILFLTKINNSKLPFGTLIKFLFIVGSILLVSYPAILSFDIFNYLATAKILFLYHENPYVVMPIEFTNDPLLMFLHASNKIALYGIVWILLSGIPFFLGFGNVLLTLFTFKLFVSLFYFASVYLLWKMTKNIYSVSLFALNPLVLVEIFVSGHNDIVMMFFALSSIYLLLKKRVGFSLILFALSILIKYATIFLFPLYLYMLWMNRKNKKIDSGKIFFYAFVSMFIIFLLSPIREEMYPWYAIWFLIFIPFFSKKTTIILLLTSFTFGLSLRYLPFMYLGTHFWITPFLRIAAMLIPVVITGFFILVKRVWSRS